MWDWYGFGTPVIRSEKCKVKVHSKYQFVFHVNAAKKRNDFMVSIGDNEEPSNGGSSNKKKSSDRK